MKVMVTGAAGQLGADVVKQLDRLRIENKGVDLRDFNLLDQEAVTNAVTAYGPDIIVHCAAYTNVDKAETEPETCCAVNGAGTLNLVRAALSAGAALLYVSTDYVFPGDGEEAFETDSPVGPKNVYGHSKLQGEEVVRTLMTRYWIVRTSWVFGLNGKNFVRTMLRLGREKRELTVVNDQVGSPTYTPDLARVICDLIRGTRYGIYHATNRGWCSWADFAEEIMRLSGYDCRIRQVTSEEYAGSHTRRPKNSRMSMKSLEQAGVGLPETWQDALAAYLKELKYEEESI